MGIITRAEPRRSWTIEQNRAIVAESLGSDLTPTEVARKHGISSEQLYTWRRADGALPGRHAAVCTGRTRYGTASARRTEAVPPAPA
jgi:transposase-like protein